MKRCLALVAAAALAFPVAAAAANQTPAPTPTPPPLPDLTALPSQTLPAWRILRPCDPAKISLQLGVQIINAGTAPSAALDAPAGIAIEDLTMPTWTGGAALPALAAGASTDLAISVPPPGGSTPPQGSHQFQITVNPQKVVQESDYTNNSMTITVDFPQCVNGVPK